MIQYVVFNLTTGEPVKWGQCQKELLDAQAGLGEKALETTALTVDGNRPIVGETLRTFRNNKIDSGAPTPFGAVDSDLESRTNIIGAAMGAVLATQLGQAFTTTWKMLDNSLVPLTANDLFIMSLAVLSYVNECHARARVLENEIETAANMAALLAIDVTSGWPAN